MLQQVDRRDGNAETECEAAEQIHLSPPATKAGHTEAVS
jgi:hypothetical protein